MKKKLAKQKKRLFAIITVSLFALSVVVFTVFAAVIYHNEKLLLFANASSSFSSQLHSISDFYVYLPITKYMINKGYNKDVQLVIRDYSSGEALAETKNALSVVFYDEEMVDSYGCIDYENFRSSMTDEQYDKISSYLNTPADSEGYYYDLLCTKYYETDGDIIPKTLEVVKTREVNTWYVQDKLAERFELEVNTEKSTTLHKIGDTYRNQIENDFFFGKYVHDDIIGEIEKKYAGEEHYADQKLYNEEPFVYTLYEYNSIVAGESDEEQQLYLLTAAYRFNVLEKCQGTFLMMGIYIIAVFSLVGVIIGAIIWKTLKKQIQQEEKLRTITNAMAHELKTPLFIIGGFAENLSENINTDKRKHYSELITEQTKEMNELVSKMIEYSKLDCANFALNMETTCLTDIVKQVFEKYRFCDIELDCEENIFINADKKLIKTVVENLIENAVKYSDDSKEIKVSCKNGEFSVSNPYKEVSKEEIRKMWEPYHRGAEESGKHGHGIGLAIVKSILDLHKMKYCATYSEKRIIFKFNF